MTILLKDLEVQAAILNFLTDSPLEVKSLVDGKAITNIGHYAIGQFDARVNLTRIVNSRGGHDLCLNHGYITKEELFTELNDMIAELTGKAE